MVLFFAAVSHDCLTGRAASIPGVLPRSWGRGWPLLKTETDIVDRHSQSQCQMWPFYLLLHWSDWQQWKTIANHNAKRDPFTCYYIVVIDSSEKPGLWLACAPKV